VDRRCTCTDSSLVRQMQNVSRRDVVSGSKQVVERLTIPLFFVFFFSPFLSFLDTTAIISYKTDKRVKAETFHGESCATSCQISELHLVQILTQTIELQR